MVMEANSSQSYIMKVVTLSQEGIWRLNNTGKDVPLETRAEILWELKVNVLRSGHDEKVVMNVMRSGLRATLEWSGLNY